MKTDIKKRLGMNENIQTKLPLGQIENALLFLQWKYYGDKSYGSIWIKYINGLQHSATIYRKPNTYKIHLYTTKYMERLIREEIRIREKINGIKS